jgi:alanyl aminopeptidase
VLPEALRPKHAAWVRGLFSKRLETIGLLPKPGDDEDTRLLRPQLVGVLGWHGQDPKVLSEANRLARAWVADRRAVPADIVDVVLSLAGAHADAGFHAELLAAAKLEKDRADRGRLLGAVADAEDRALVQATLPLVLTDTFETREAMRLVWGAANDFRTRDLALSFVKQHWEPLIAKLPKDGGAGLIWLSSGLCEEKSRDEARAFFDGRATKYLGGPRNLAIAMEGVDLCIAWRTRHRASASSFFERAK